MSLSSLLPLNAKARHAAEPSRDESRSFAVLVAGLAILDLVIWVYVAHSVAVQPAAPPPQPLSVALSQPRL